MHTTTTLEAFHDALNKARFLSAFSLTGREALYNHITRCEADTATSIELDVYKLVSEYTESTIEEAGGRLDTPDAKAYLRERTTLIEVTPDVIIYREF